jgi:hypothetical protein
MIRNKPLLAGLAVVTVGVLSACSGPSGSHPTHGAATEAAPIPPPDHVWRSDGYGWIVTLTGTEERTYQTTAISCLPGKALQRVGPAAADGALGFGAGDVPTLTMRTQPDGRATLRPLGSVADIDLLPLPALPPSCGRPVPNTPVSNFDVFWQTFAENYNSFGRKHIDWVALRNQYRPLVSDDTSDKQLFKILTRMITPLGDAHASIEEGGDGRGNGDSFAGVRPGTRDEDEVSRDQATKAVDKHLKRDLDVSDIQTFANDRIAYAQLPDGRGYLRITAFEGYQGKGTPFVTGSAVLRQVLDSVFTQANVKSWRGLVVDVRFNTGGDDALGLQVAGRLTDKPYLAFRKQARNDPKDPSRHGPLRPVTVDPTEGVPHYTGPVWLLTSDLTVSAGETFVEAMLGRAPAPVRTGSATQGVFADDMGRTLPNGWTFTVGNEEYFDPNGHDYEGVGIPPNVNEPVFTHDELKEHEDSALDAAR